MKYLKNITAILLATLFAYASANAQTQSKYLGDRNLQILLKKDLTGADDQYHLLINSVPPGVFPRIFENGNLSTVTSDAWISGFYPGTLLYLYAATHDEIMKHEAENRLGLLEKEQYNKTTHDLGFMMYCSFGNALKLNPDSTRYKTILINSARSLASRFSEKVGCLRSWNSSDNTFLVIIDNMINLELLLYAAKATGDSSFYHIAVTHANTTMKNHFRPDHSSYHVVEYDNNTGQVIRKRTAQGYADGSAWARGQAWGLYGFTMMYRETHDLAYLKQARKIADFILHNPNLPDDLIPYWDYNAPDIPIAYRDASAGAVNCAALLELAALLPKKEGLSYFKSAEKMLLSLSSAKYQSPKGGNGGFILTHSVGNYPGKAEIDVPLTYADYYYLEACLRYQQITGTKTSKNRI